jgi:WD40 repeat protein
MLASGGEDGTIRLYAAENGALLRTLHGTRGSVYSIALSPDARTLGAAIDGAIQLWDMRSGLPLRTLLGHDGDVYSITWSPDGRTLASGSSDGTIRLWAGTFDSLVAQARNAVRLFTLGPDECQRYLASPRCP